MGDKKTTIDKKKEFEKNLNNFIKDQLIEMKKNVKKHYKKNQGKRENNNFLLFNDENAKRYMGMGRSIDSQLGTRLENIAFFLAREKYSFKCVPNIVNLIIKNKELTVQTLSYPIKNGFSQYIYMGEQDLCNLLPKKIKDKECEICEYEFNLDANLDIDAAFNKMTNTNNKTKTRIPVDLLFFQLKTDKKNKKQTEIVSVNAYEIKAGGVLDTKNAEANAREVNNLNSLLSFVEKCNCKFATCYDGNGNGEPVDSLLSNLSRDKIVIAKEFWSEILPDYFDYNSFIETYKKAFDDAKVEDYLINE